LLGVADHTFVVAAIAGLSVRVGP